MQNESRLKTKSEKHFVGESDFTLEINFTLEVDFLIEVDFLLENDSINKATMKAPISIKEFVDIVEEAANELIDKANDGFANENDLTEDGLFTRTVDNLEYSYHIETGKGTVAPWIETYWDSDMVKQAIGGFLERVSNVTINDDEDPYEWGGRC